MAKWGLVWSRWQGANTADSFADTNNILVRGGSAHNSNIFIPAMTSNANKLLRDYSLARQISRFFMLMISAQPGNLNPFEGVVFTYWPV